MLVWRRSRKARETVKSIYVALIRGINVGTAKRVGMTELCALVEELGYSEVRTLLNSGNVVLSGAKAEPRETTLRIEKAIEAKLRVSARVTVISAEELAEVIAGNLFEKIADDPSRLPVGILADVKDREKPAEKSKKDWGSERIAMGTAHAVYMWLPQGVIESKLNAAVSKALGDGMTSRSWATMLKLKEMTEEVRTGIR